MVGLCQGHDPGVSGAERAVRGPARAVHDGGLQRNAAVQRGGAGDGERGKTPARIRERDGADCGTDGGGGWVENTSALNVTYAMASSSVSGPVMAPGANGVPMVHGPLQHPGEEFGGLHTEGNGALGDFFLHE